MKDTKEIIISKGIIPIVLIILFLRKIGLRYLDIFIVLALFGLYILVKNSPLIKIKLKKEYRK